MKLKLTGREVVDVEARKVFPEATGESFSIGRLVEVEAVVRSGARVDVEL